MSRVAAAGIEQTTGLPSMTLHVFTNDFARDHWLDMCTKARQKADKNEPEGVRMNKNKRAKRACLTAFLSSPTVLDQNSNLGKTKRHYRKRPC